MIRLGRALKQTTAHTAALASLLALVACGVDGRSVGVQDSELEDPNAPPAFEGEVPGATGPEGMTDGEGTEPAGTGNMPPVGSSTGENGEGNPGDVPLAPPDQTGTGNGSGEEPTPVPQPTGMEPTGTDPTDTQPSTEPPANEPPANEPPPTEPPANEPPPVEPPPPQVPTFAENTGADCAVPQLPNTAALPTINGLPDPFVRVDGTRVSTLADWRCRRNEIKEQAERYIYGDKPSRPTNVSGNVSANNITVNVSHQGASTSFSVSVQGPTNGAQQPYPALVSVGGFSHNNLVRQEGVAVINFDPFDVGDEAASRENKTGAFYDIYGAQSSTGLLVAWAWGVSRIIDVIEQSGANVIQPDAIAVAGCSRFGKGAFTIGAFDERIALTIPFESGTGGVPIWRGIGAEGAQSAASAFGEQHWLGDVFGLFTNGVTRLPVDTHSIVGMVAPRGLLILDNPHIANLGPRSAHVAALAGAEIYEALGARDNISYHSAVASGTHCQARPEHQEPLRQNIRKFLHGTGNTPGAITAAGSATGNVGQFVNWTTPTLQ